MNQSEVSEGAISKPFLLGPFFVKDGDASYESEWLKFTGVSLSFSTADESSTVPIYLWSRSTEWGPRFYDFYFPADYCPFTVLYNPDVEAMRNSTGEFISLGRMIGAMFADYSPSCTLFDLLGKLCTYFEFVPMGGWKIERDCLIGSLSSQGFALESVMAHGDTIVAEICWAPQNIHVEEAKPKSFNAVGIKFRPKPDGTLGDGIWWTPRKNTINFHLFSILQSKIGKRPVECFSPKGVSRCLSEFSWEPKHRMTKAELAAKRRSLIAENVSLWSDPRSLATLLKEKGLYSNNTSLHQIKAFIEREIAQAQGEESGPLV